MRVHRIFLGMSGLGALLLSACAARAPQPPPGLAVDWPRYEPDHAPCVSQAFP